MLPEPEPETIEIVTVAGAVTQSVSQAMPDDRAALGRRLAELEAELTQATNAAAIQARQYEVLRERADADAAASGAQLGRLEKQMATERMAAAEAARQAVALRQVYDQLHQEHDRLRQDRDRLQQELEAKQRAFTELDARRELQQREIAKLGQHNLALDDDLRQQQQEVDRLSHSLAQAEQARMAQQRQWQHEVRNLYRIGRDEAAVRRFEVMREELTNPLNPALAWSLNDVALLMVAEGRLAEAEPLFRRALFVLEQAPDGYLSERGTLTQHLADLRWRLGDLEETASLYRESVKLLESSLGGEHPRLAVALNGCASVLRALGREEEAESLYRRAIHIYEEGNAENASGMAAALHNLGLMQMSRKNYGEAEKLLLRADGLLENNPDASSVKKTVVLESLARFYAATGDLQKSLLYEQKVRETALKLNSP